MKFESHHVVARRGILLLETMVYVALVGIVLLLAAALFDRALRQSTGLQRNIADIERALKAGERWRADVRAATGAIGSEGSVFTIPQGEGRVVYEVETNRVRRVAVGRPVEVFLAGVKASKMVEERRGSVVGWRWEVELEQRRKEARVRPLFTFLAVAGGAR